MSRPDALQQRMDYSFRDGELLVEALTHPSAVQDRSVARHNQRLEFLGDAVLQLILTQELFRQFTDMGEGPLTKARAQLVNRWSLAERSRELDVGCHLILSRGEEMNGGRERDSALADAFEALVGAVFQDGGFDPARKFVLSRFQDVLGDLEVLPNLENPKGDLQEMLQAGSNESPVYELISVAGPDHSREFECSVHHEGRELGRGKGRSKKVAEAQAALEALKSLRQEGR